VQIALGVPVKEFSFGNTLMTTGAITTCTGAVMIGIWIAIREFRNAVQRLGAVAPQHPAAAFQSAPGPAALREPLHEDDGFALDRGQPAPAHAAEAVPATSPAAVPPPSLPPWHDEAAGRDRGRADVAGAPPADPAVKQRRNLLFSSTSRKERERAEARTTDAPATGAPAIPPAVPPPTRASETPPGSFEEAWPQQRRGGRTPSTFAEAGAGAAVADRTPPAPRTEEPAPVTVLKSGVVDGMAYSLYSDGSIEAQMPEGMMRFASIDELRAHLDQRG
jgi:hypothetical protein